MQRYFLQVVGPGGPAILNSINALASPTCPNDATVRKRFFPKFSNLSVRPPWPCMALAKTTANSLADLTALSIAESVR